MKNLSNSVVNLESSIINEVFSTIKSLREYTTYKHINQDKNLNLNKKILFINLSVLSKSIFTGIFNRKEKFRNLMYKNKIIQNCLCIILSI